MKKGDLIIILIVGIIITGFSYMYLNKDYDKYFVEITYDGQIVEYFELTDEVDIVIELRHKGYNKLQVKDGYVDMLEADCPDKIDVLQAPITYDSWNKTIICAPNKIVVRIVGGNEQAIDGIV